MKLDISVARGMLLNLGILKVSGTAPAERFRVDQKRLLDVLAACADDFPRQEFVPPTVQEVRCYCTERRNTVDAERFVAYYSSKGWMVGKSPMKNWRSAVHTWENSPYNGNGSRHEKRVQEIRDVRNAAHELVRRAQQGRVGDRPTSNDVHCDGPQRAQSTNTSDNGAGSSWRVVRPVAS
jgi:hypothetical protein